MRNILYFKTDAGIPPPCFLQVVGHTQQTLPKYQKRHFVYVFLLAPRPTDGVFSARSSDHPNCFIRLLTVP